MTPAVTKPKPTPKRHDRKVRVGDKVGLQWGGRLLPADVIEDRGMLGPQGQQVVRLDVPDNTTPSDALQIEVPVDELVHGMMVRVHGIVLRNEVGGYEDVSNEVVAWLAESQARSPWTLEVHFGLRRARRGFVGHRYSVTLPREAAKLVMRKTVQDGFQLGGTLRIVKGRIVIDDPITRAKPAGRRIWHDARA